MKHISTSYTTIVTAFFQAYISDNLYYGKAMTYKLRYNVNIVRTIAPRQFVISQGVAHKYNYCISKLPDLILGNVILTISYSHFAKLR